MRYALWFRTVSFYIILSLAVPLPAFSQQDNPAGQEQEEQKRFSNEELAQLLAPIALYPDELLSQVLMAATYPLEIVSADRWLEENKSLSPDELAARLEEKEWDPSVKSLVNFPSVLSMMSRKLEITSRLGDAFLAQEKDVMDTVQFLRKKALDTGNLKSTKEQRVEVEQQAVLIEPVAPEVVYVPTYDPMVVYGPWFYPAYPPYPYYFYEPPALYIGFASAVTIGFAWGYAWGGCNWRSHAVIIDINRHQHVRNRYIHRDRYIRHYERRVVIDRDGQGRWRHDPVHRRGVAYRDIRTAQRFGQSPARVMRDRVPRRPADFRSRGRVEAPVRQQRGTVRSEQRGRVRQHEDGGQAPVRVRQHEDGGQAPVKVRQREDGGQAPVKVQPGAGEKQRKGDGDTSSVRGSREQAPRRESVFSGGQGDGDAARSASERGRRSRESSGFFNRGGGFERGAGSGDRGRRSEGSGGGRSGGGRHRE